MKSFSAKLQPLWILSLLVGIITYLLAVILCLEIADFDLVFNWYQYILVSLGLLATGSVLSFTSLSAERKPTLQKMGILWFIIFIIGMLIIFIAISDSFVLFGDPGMLYNRHTLLWNDLYILGIVPTLFGGIALFTFMSIETKEKIWKAWPLWLLVGLIGVIFCVLAFLDVFDFWDEWTKTYSGLSCWEEFFAIGVTFMLFGFGIFLMSISDFKKELGWTFRHLWGLILLVGFFLVDAAIFAYYNVFTPIQLTQETMGIFVVKWDSIGLVGLTMLFTGVLFYLVMYKEADGWVQANGLVWNLMVLLGFLFFILGLVTAMDDLIGIEYWLNVDVSLLFGLTILTLGLAFDYRILSIEGAEFSPRLSRLATITDEEAKIEIKPEEMISFYKVSIKASEQQMKLFQRSRSENKISDAIFKRVQRKIYGEIDEYQSKIVSTQKESERQDLLKAFTEELGTGKPAAKVAKPAAPSASKPSPPSKAPPAPLPSPLKTPPRPPSAAPAPPPMSRPAPPSAAPAPPPMPRPTPPPAVPKPSAPQPTKPGQDVSSQARSTSIAELRGEMLKELRRLRDIFQDDEG